MFASLESISNKLKQKVSESDKVKYRTEASEASSPLLREGQILFNKVQNTKVKEIITHVRAKHDSIQRQTQNRRMSDDDEIVSLNRIVEKLTGWLTNIGEEFVTINKHMGTTTNAAVQFQSDHQQLFEELNNIKKQIADMKARMPKHSKKRKKIIFELSEKLEVMQSKSVTLSSRIKYRIVMVKMFVGFLTQSDDVIILFVTVAASMGGGVCDSCKYFLNKDVSFFFVDLIDIYFKPCSFIYS